MYNHIIGLKCNCNWCKPRCPYKYKYELVNWASNRFNRTKSFFNSKSKKQLYAIYYNAK